jgi:gluconokinase
VPPDMVVPPPGLWLYLIDGKRGVLGGALTEGGNLLAWLDEVLKLPTLKDAEPLAAKVPPDGHGLTILPFIGGERSLGWHAEARMTVSGISLHTAPEELLRAGMEALACQLHAVYEQLHTVLPMNGKPPQLIGSGGALLSSMLLQEIVSDTLDAALYPSHDTEASARGAALLALEALGLIADVAQIPPAIGAGVQPNNRRGAIYRKEATRQRELYQKLLGN